MGESGGGGRRNALVVGSREEETSMSMIERSAAAEGRAAPRPTIFVAIEMSRSKWVVALHTPLADEIGCHAIAWGDALALRALIERQRVRVEGALGAAPEVLCCYEAGHEGFWLQRLLGAAGLRALVIDPASLLANRKARRAKTDRVDARAMVRALMAFARGEDQALGAVRVPSLEREDERRRLLAERIAHTNCIKALLTTQGIVGFDPRARGAAERLDDLVSGDGRRLGPRLRDEIVRELARLAPTMERLAAVEAERDAIVERAQAVEVGADPNTVEGDAPAHGDAAMMGALVRLKGVGMTDATVLVQGAFWRGFRNRRELAAWSGLAPTPWASGDVAREQGIAKAGPPAFRAQMMQMTWRWLHRQAGSELARWFERRTSGSRSRTRRIMAVALARKLLVALWRYATTGLVPRGAVMS